MVSAGNAVESWWPRAAMILQPTGHGYAHPLIFLSLLAGSAVASIFKVDLPLAHQGATLSSSFAFEFAALLLIGQAK